MSLTDPFGWQISTFMAWSMEKGKKGLFMGPGFFGRRMVQPRKVPVATGKPADGERYGGVVWVFRLIGITVTFLPGTRGMNPCPVYDVSRTGLKTGFQRNVRSSDFFKKHIPITRTPQSAPSSVNFHEQYGVPGRVSGGHDRHSGHYPGINSAGKHGEFDQSD